MCLQSADAAIAQLQLQAATMSDYQPVHRPEQQPMLRPAVRQAVQMRPDRLPGLPAALSPSIPSAGSAAGQIHQQHAGVSPWTNNAAGSQSADAATGSLPSVSHSRPAFDPAAPPSSAKPMLANSMLQARSTLPRYPSFQSSGPAAPFGQSKASPAFDQVGSQPLRSSAQPAQPSMRADTDLENLQSVHQHVPAYPRPAQLHGSRQPSAVSRSQHQLQNSSSCAAASPPLAMRPPARSGRWEVPSAAAPVHQPRTSIDIAPDASHGAVPPAHQSLRYTSGVSHTVPPFIPQAVEPLSDVIVHTSSSEPQPDDADMPLDFISALDTILRSNPVEGRLLGSFESDAHKGLGTSRVQHAPGLVPVPSMLPPQGALQQMPGSSSMVYSRALGPAAGLVRETGSTAYHHPSHDGRAGSIMSNNPGTPCGSIMPGSQDSAAVPTTLQSVQAAPRSAGPQQLGAPALSLQGSSGTVETTVWPSHLANASGTGVPGGQVGKVLSSGRAARGQNRQKAARSFSWADQGSVGTGPMSIMRPISLNVNDCHSARITHMQVRSSVAFGVEMVEECSSLLRPTGCLYVCVCVCVCVCGGGGGGGVAHSVDITETFSRNGATAGCMDSRSSAQAYLMTISYMFLLV